MTQAELDREIERLHDEGKRDEVVALMRKFGLFNDEQAVSDYLRELREMAALKRLREGR